MSQKKLETESIKQPFSFALNAEALKADFLPFCLANGVVFVSAHNLTAEGDNLIYAENKSRFGGFSGFSFDDSRNVIMLSDRSYYLKVDFYSREVLDSVATMGTLKADQGEVLEYEENDVEEVEYYNGNCFISHERVNKVSYYRNCDFEVKPNTISIPAGIQGFHKYMGMESLAIDGYGNFVTAEEYNSTDYSNHNAFLWSYEGSDYSRISAETHFFYKSSEGFSASGFDYTCNGNLLVLERRVVVLNEFIKSNSKAKLKFESKVKFIPQNILSNITNGDVVSGTEIIDIHYGNNAFLSDNFEAIESECISEHETHVYLLSDDNQSPDQNTILLRFNIDEKKIESDFLEYGIYSDETTVDCIETIYPFCVDL